jgi:serine/threonine protein phosphatase PrpC
MSSHSPDPNTSRPGSWLARLRGVAPEPASAAAPPATPAPAASAPSNNSEEELLPTFDLPPTFPEAAVPPEAAPPPEAPAPPETPAAPPQLCPICESPRSGDQKWCDSCGYMFPPGGAPLAAAAGGNPGASEPGTRINGRYELVTLLNERQGVARFRGLDHGDSAAPPVPVIILRQERPAVAAVAEVSEAPLAEVAEDELLPTFGDVVPTAGPTTGAMPPTPAWPSVAWERNLLDVVQHPSLPTVLDSFEEGNYDYLIEELPTGQTLWDAWDDPEADAEKRFGLLKQVAEGLHQLHQGGAILEGIRPDIVIITDDGRARISDLSDLLPLPLPPDVPIRASHYTAPELLAVKPDTDARSDLYSFGAMLYALHVGRELIDKDFDRPGAPKPFIPRFPDIHPAFGRLVTKTFCQDLGYRFPTDEAAKEDPTGFTELIRTLEVCGRTLDNVRLEIAAWTTTGMIRTGNEDAFALLHACESRIDDVNDATLIFLCDGMGGYEAGEVAAAMAIQTLRRYLVNKKPFRALAGGATFPIEGLPADPDTPEPIDTEAMKKLFIAALKDTNKQVFNASRSGVGRRGMGCTAEVVYVDSKRVVVGHVGDSRTYHLHEGRLVQLTRDQTLVNRLVELGTLTPEEAETHPRRNELQQAIGGQPDVEPGVYSGVMKPGDWVVVCSDGVTNHVKPDDLKQMLLVEAGSADVAARRLVNFVNINGATDNATIVVVRAV